MHRRLFGLGTAYFCAAGIVAQAEVWFVDSNAPPGGDGAQATPFSRLSDVENLIDSGDTVHLKGEFRETLVPQTGLTDVLISNWPDESAPFVIRGDRPLTDWEGGPLIYSAPVPASVSIDDIASVVWNYDQSIDSSGRHFGHLRDRNDEGVLDVDGSWRRGVDGDHRIYIRPPEGASSPHPSTQNVAWVEADLDLIDMRVATDSRVENGLFYLSPSKNPQADGYAVKFSRGATRCEIRNCVSFDSGLHAFGFANGLGETVDCVIRDCKAYGAIHLQPTNAPTLYIFHSKGGPGGGAYGCRTFDVEGHCYPGLLADHTDEEASYLREGLKIVGVHHHTSLPQGDLIADVEHHRMRIVGYPGAVSSPFEVANCNPLDPSLDPFDPAAYPVRFFDSIAEGCSHYLGGPSVDRTVAFVRTRFDFLGNAEEHGGTDRLADPVQSCMVFGGSFSVEDYLFSSSTIQIGVGDAAIPAPIAVTGRDSERTIRLDGSTVFLVGATDLSEVAHLYVDRDAAEIAIHARQTVFASQSPLMFANFSPLIELADRAASMETWQFEANWYSQIATDSYAAHPQYDGAAEWANLQDSPTEGAIFDIDPGFQSAPDNLAPAAMSPLLMMTHHLAGSERRGIEGNPYSGHYGAYQFGAPADLNVDGAVSAADISIMLGSWGDCGLDPCWADLNGDGVVSAHDLAELLGAWSPGD